ncbi:uridine kinase [Desulfonispora thiosulfatigenes DSM 11270]|uniref:Uridine kinase n=1 Tax=Desulfonispora thiosulfatigenes DSM 11270 TaxID=656914 RepID=A0A1W1UQE1_DESTI|nr:nucleoside kinase [Desulfonispora thiosulfatigenes]SMB83253.1 uridine kinase [Desulfonispora thiosulfatigenes DSM 11270]
MKVLNQNLINVEVNNQPLQIDQGSTLEDILKVVPAPLHTPLAAIVNGQIQELTYPIYADSNITWIDTTNDIGMRIYKRGLFLVLATAVNNIFPKATLKIEHSLPHGTYCEIRCEDFRILVEENVNAIKNEMKRIIAENRPIKRQDIFKNDAIKFFQGQGRFENANNIKYKPGDTVSLYSCGTVFDYFYEPVATSTGVLKLFDLHSYHYGLILRIPAKNNPNILPTYHAPQKLSQILYEGERWGELLEVENIAQLNNIIETNQLGEFVQINEALHERNLYEIAKSISDHNDEVKLILIAGPSSSGKTTFAHRLYIQLRVNGIKPITISLDDYFVDREFTPKDENGGLDFESINALDLELFNRHLVDLIDGKEVIVPRFDFTTGRRKAEGHKVKLEANQVLIIEGIHGLNEKLTESIPHSNKRKIYISALTQLNVDDWTPISSSDTRLIRRIYRDIQYRGTSAKQTINRWPSVRKGEAKNIFPFQEEADYMFNSALIYEKAILKGLVQPELEKIGPGEPEFLEAQRLIRLLQFFVPAFPDNVPINSILKEFIGGSCFRES